MCGIAGIYRFDRQRVPPRDVAALEAMAATLSVESLTMKRCIGRSGLILATAWRAKRIWGAGFIGRLPPWKRKFAFRDPRTIRAVRLHFVERAEQQLDKTT